MGTHVQIASPLNRVGLAGVIDHTQVKAYATQVDIAELCDEAVRLGLFAVTVNPVWVAYCAKRLAESEVLINATVGFPLGANTAVIKVAETEEAIRNGAREIDMVINIGALKSGAHDYVAKEIRAITRAAGDAPVKVILETAYLSQDEKLTVCQLAADNGAAFVKTSTGFAPTGATIADVRLMRDAVGDRLGVKAAGGIRSLRDARAMLDAGATRLGTSSAADILADCAE